MPIPSFLRLAGALAACVLTGLGAAQAAPPAAPLQIDDTLVREGARLAAIGNCISCHTAAHGKSFAGGRALDTPFGTLYSTNITPDPETGIGRYSAAEFLRAMHEGIAKDGRHLYPVFPYDHFAQAKEADVRAIYAFLMTRAPVKQTRPANHMRFPANIRGGVAAWNALFLGRGGYVPDPNQSAQWNRGAYLAEALAHCSACHTPRNLLGAEKQSLAYGGGDAEGWRAPALNHASAAPIRWNADAVYAYLRRGAAPDHGVAGGPMAEVVENLRMVPDEDVRAIAVYAATLGNSAPAVKPQRGNESDARTLARGAAIYSGACASCHDGGHGALELTKSTAVALDMPDNFVRIVRGGLTPADGSRGAWMPAFGAALTDAQLADLAAWLRAQQHKPDWGGVESAARRAREQTVKTAKADTP